MNWYLKVLRQYADFNGRARRKEFWLFVLFNVVIAYVFKAIDGIFNMVVINTDYGLEIGPLYIIYSLFVLIPSIAVAVRRLHDTGRSGWWYFIGFVPIVGTIWLIVLWVLDSQPGTNEYGPNPKVEEEPLL